MIEQGVDYTKNGQRRSFVPYKSEIRCGRGDREAETATAADATLRSQRSAETTGHRAMDGRTAKEIVRL